MRPRRLPWEGDSHDRIEYIVHHCRVRHHVAGDPRLPGPSRRQGRTRSLRARPHPRRPVGGEQAVKRSWVIGGGVVILAAFAWLLFGGLEKNVVFFLTPAELLAK